MVSELMRFYAAIKNYIRKIKRRMNAVLLSEYLRNE